jgi:hypothetical protein
LGLVVALIVIMIATAQRAKTGATAKAKAVPQDSSDSQAAIHRIGTNRYRWLL